jgi:hypothetical protein
MICSDCWYGDCHFCTPILRLKNAIPIGECGCPHWWGKDGDTGVEGYKRKLKRQRQDRIRAVNATKKEETPTSNSTTWYKDFSMWQDGEWTA